MSNQGQRPTYPNSQENCASSQREGNRVRTLKRCAHACVCLCGGLGGETSQAVLLPKSDVAQYDRALLQDPEDVEMESDGPNGAAKQQESFNRILTEQSSVFQRLYDAAERRKEQIETRRSNEEKMEQREARRMSNVSARMINPRSRAMAEIGRGNQDVFKRLYDEGKKSGAKKEEEKQRAATRKAKQELAERTSEYNKTRVLDAFHPDIGPAAREYQRKGNLLENLDARGRRKRQELQLRDAVQRAQTMQGCTFHPHITQRSKNIGNARRDETKSVHLHLYQDGLRRHMQRRGNAV